MDRTPRIPPPSAMDGYRRLERARRPDAGDDARAATGAAPHPAPAAMSTTRSNRASRVTGALRLVGFLAVIAMIVGTSVTLASADSNEGVTKRTAAATAVEPVAELVEPVSEGPTEAATEADAPVKDEPVQEAPVELVAAEASEPVAAEATTAPARASTPVARVGEQLPLTGEPSAVHVLLFGSVLVLVGMLVQIAGQPLPASARAARVR